MIRKPIKQLSTDSNTDRLAEFVDADTLSSYTFSNDPTGKTYTTGANISATFDNLDTEINRIGAVVNPAIPCFRAYTNTGIYWNLYATAHLTKKIIFEVQEFDLSSSYDTVTGRFTAPSTGFYMFVAMHSLKDVKTGTSYEHEMFLYKNNTEYKAMFHEAGQGDNDNRTYGHIVSATGSCQIHLNQNEYVDIYVTIGGGATTYNQNNDQNSKIGREYLWFSGYLVSKD